VIVVEFGRADTHGDIEYALFASAGIVYCSERAGDGLILLLGDFVAEKVRRRLSLLLEDGEVAG
jgi:hypothetical protein